MFQEFQDEIGTEVQSVAQLILHQYKIVAAIAKGIKRKLLDAEETETESSFIGSVADGTRNKKRKHHEDNVTTDSQAIQSDTSSKDTQFKRCIVQYDDRDENVEALDPLLQLTVAIAKDIPKDFFNNHFHVLFPHIASHSYYSYTKDAERIEQVFTCITQLILIMEKHLSHSAYKFYATYFTDLLSEKRPWKLKVLAAESLSCLIRKLSNNEKEVFFTKALGRLKKDPSQVIGLGKLVTAMMKSFVRNRLDFQSKFLFHILLKALSNPDLPNKLVQEVILNGLEGVAYFVTEKNPSGVDWKPLWVEDGPSIWTPLWNQLNNVVKSNTEDEKRKLTVTTVDGSNDNIEMKLVNLLTLVEFLVAFKRGALVLKLKDLYDNLHFIVHQYQSENIACLATGIFTTVLKTENLVLSRDEQKVANLIQTQKSEMISEIFNTAYPASVTISFVRNCCDAPNYEEDILPNFFVYLNTLIGSSVDHSVKRNGLMLLLDILLNQQAPVRCGDELDQWNKYEVTFERYENDSIDISSVPGWLEKRIMDGLSEDLTSIEDLLVALMCLPHVSQIDYIEISMFLSQILTDALTQLKVKSKTVVEAESLTPKPQKRKSLPQKENESDQTSSKLDFNIDCTLDVKTKKLLFLIDTVIECMAHILSNENFIGAMSGLLDVDNVVTILTSFPQYRENIHLLRSVDIYLTISASTDSSSENEQEIILSDALFCDLYRILAPALSSCNAQTRLLVTHILSLFPLKLPPPPEGCKTRIEGLFSIMYQLEREPVTPANYRERLRLMEQLRAEHCTAHSPTSGLCSQAPVLFAIGQMYINFSHIWRDTVSFLAEYADKMEEADFWHLWYAKLKLVDHAVRSACVNVDTSMDFGSDSNLTQVAEYLSRHEGFSKVSTAADHFNVRNHMWKSMHKFPRLCESQRSSIIDSFFEFLREEMHVVDFSTAPTENITQHSQENSHYQAETESEEWNDVDCDVKEDKTAKNGKQILNTLCNYLVLFSQFKNLKGMIDSQKLEKICLDLLVHPSPRIQEHALQCLCSFKHKFLTPYKEQLLKIHGEKTFRSGVSEFRVCDDGDSSSVNESHRVKLIPIYIRVLFGRMQTNTGKNTAGKNKASKRKQVVMRLFAGIKDDESQCLLDIAFEIINPHLRQEKSVHALVKKNLDHKISLTDVIPLKKLLGVLDTLDKILEYLGNLLPTKKAYFFKVIMFVLSYAVSLLQQSSDIDSRYVSMLKKIKREAMSQLLKFCNNHFTDYKYSNDEIEAVFETVVWNNLPKLSSESLIHIHPLLKLFELWSENERCHSLFLKHHPDQKTLTPLPYLFCLIEEPKCKMAVINFILKIVYNLMTFENQIKMSSDEIQPPKKKNRYEKHCKNSVDADSFQELVTRGEVTMYDCDNLLPIVEPEARIEGSHTTFGTKILLPYADKLSKCLHNQMSHIVKKKNNEQMRILCEITRFVASSSVGDQFLRVIVSLISKKKVTDQDVIAHLLLVCSHLLPISDSKIYYCLKLVSLFRSVSGKEIRDVLCRAFRTLAKSVSKYSYLAGLMEGLNSYEKSISEVVDVNSRLKVYKNVIEKIENFDKDNLKCILCDEMLTIATTNEENGVSTNHSGCVKLLFSFLINQCSYDIEHIGDITIDEACMRCFSAVIKCSLKFYDSDKSVFEFVNDLALSRVKNGIKSSSDKIHCIYMRLLGTQVQESGSRFKQLKDLTNILNLQHNNVDFFNKVAHLQMMQRGKAIARLVSSINDSSLTLKTESIEVYIWPLLSRYLTQNSYAEDASLLSAAIDGVGAIASVLPWASYLEKFKFFISILLGKNCNVRMILKVVCTILDAFHEDVSDLSTKSSNCTFTKPTSKSDVVVNNDMSENSAKLPDDISKDLNFNRRKSGDVQGQQRSHSENVLQSLKQQIIPSIKKVFDLRSAEDKKHKLNKTGQTDADDIKKIPLALPLVKILKKFPVKALEENLSNVFYNLMEFLKSRIARVRQSAREMIINVLQEVGGKFLPLLIKDLKANLNLGFQRHVFLFTVRAILISSEKFLKPEDVCRSVNDIIPSCINELFKSTDDNSNDLEREQEKQSATVEEGKGDKSYKIITIIGKFVKVDRLQDVMKPLKEILDTTHSKSVVKIVQKCLECFSCGLYENEAITIKEKSIFINGILTDRILELKNKKEEERKDDFRKRLYDRPHPLLFEQEPKRVKVSSKTANRTNSYVFVEFSLMLLVKLLSNNVYKATDKEHCGLLDPMITLISGLIDSQDPEVIYESLKSLCVLVQYPLPSLQQLIHSIVCKLFVLLNKYSNSECVEGKVYNLVDLSYRSLSIIIRSVKYYQIEDKHLKVLTIYMKENLADNSHRIIVFSLLRTLLYRKVQCEDMDDIMDSVMKFVVTETTADSLAQARSIMVDYITNYEIPYKRVHNIIEFFADNLDYDSSESRISVCLMLDILIANVPENVLRHKNLRRHVCRCLEIRCHVEADTRCFKYYEQSLMRLFKNSTDKEFWVAEFLPRLKEESDKSRLENLQHIHCATLGLIGFMSKENNEANNTDDVSLYPIAFLTEIAPKVINLLNPSRIIAKVTPSEEQEQSSEELQATIDFCVEDLLRLFLKFFLTYKADKRWLSITEGDIWEHICEYMNYHLVTVRINAAQIIAGVLMSYPYDKPRCAPKLCNTPENARYLAELMISQFNTPGGMNAPVDQINQLFTLVVKILMYLIQQCKKVPLVTKSILSNNDGDNTTMKSRKLAKLKSELSNVEKHGIYAGSFMWILGMIAIPCYEDMNTKKVVYRREFTLKFIGAFMVVMAEKKIYDFAESNDEEISEYIIKYLERERKGATEEVIVEHVKQAAEVIQERIGWDKYSALRQKILSKESARRLSKKVKAKEQVVSNPQAAEQQKFRKSQASSLAKKRKRGNGFEGKEFTKKVKSPCPSVENDMFLN